LPFRLRHTSWWSCKKPPNNILDKEIKQGVNMREYAISNDLYQEISRLKYLGESLTMLCKKDNFFTFMGFELSKGVILIEDITRNLDNLMKEIEMTESVTSTTKEQYEKR
jgi:hypothetical protein